VALALASAFFDCDDLDEASISKLAPVERRPPVEIPLDQIEKLAEMCERSIATLDDGEADAEKSEELHYYLNFYRDLIAKRSG
jgi:hypothetical protein